MSAAAVSAASKQRCHDSGQVAGQVAGKARRRAALQRRRRDLSDAQRKVERDQCVANERVSVGVSDAEAIQDRIEQLLRPVRVPVVDGYYGWVYMIPTVRLIEERQYCKIGFSRDPDERFKSLCTNNPHALDLTAVRAFRGTLAQETTLKQITAAYTTDGANEWRAFPPDVYNLIASILPLFAWFGGNAEQDETNSLALAAPTIGSKRRRASASASASAPACPSKRPRLMQRPGLRSSGPTMRIEYLQVPEFLRAAAETIVPFAQYLLAPDSWTQLCPPSPQPPPSPTDDVLPAAPMFDSGMVSLSALFSAFRGWLDDHYGHEGNDGCHGYSLAAAWSEGDFLEHWRGIIGSCRIYTRRPEGRYLALSHSDIRTTITRITDDSL